MINAFVIKTAYSLKPADYAKVLKDIYAYGGKTP